MKDTATHRKRTKSESDSRKTPEHKDGQHTSTGKGAQHGSQHGGSKHGSHPGGQHASHAAHHSSHQKSGHGHHKSDHGHHKGGHHKGDHHGHHDDHGHQDGDHHHLSASSHPYRPRRDTMLSRGGHSTHHESDRRSVGTNEGGSVPPMVHYENTYKMSPDDTFQETKIKDIIRAVLRENITENKYDSSVCGAKCQLISEIIKERVKKLNMSRFKIVCMATIGQIFDQSMIVTSRCLWNHKFDNSVSVEYKTADIIAVAVVFAVYAE